MNNMLEIVRGLEWSSVTNLLIAPYNTHTIHIHSTSVGQTENASFSTPKLMSVYLK